MRSLALKVSITTTNMDLQNAYFSFKLLVFSLVLPSSARHSTERMRALINPTQGRLFLLATRHNPSKTWLLLSLRSVGWNLYPQFIAWRACLLLSQHRFSLALKHSFQPPFAAKRVAPKPLGESLSAQSSKFPKTDATHF